jgi:CheY-like chemotaxis protein
MPQNSIDIVVVDDSQVLLSVLSEILKECGHSIRIASDGLEALAEIRYRAPDILLSDLNMPRMSGFELLSIVRRRYPRIKVIATSASFSGQSVPRGVAADAFYEKGATSVVRLLQIVDAMKDESELRSLRVSTPIWISRSPFDSGSGSGALFACPECLRAYQYSVEEDDCVHHRSCTYCRYRIQLAIVPTDTEVGTRSLVHFRY